MSELGLEPILPVRSAFSDSETAYRVSEPAADTRLSGAIRSFRRRECQRRHHAVLECICNCSKQFRNDGKERVGAAA